MDVWTDILYFHSGFFNPLPVAACSARNYRPRRWSPKRDADDQVYRQRDGRTYNIDRIPLGDKCIATWWTPKLESNTNTKISKIPADDRMYGRTYYTDTQGIWTFGLRPHSLHAIRGHADNHQKVMQTTRQRYRETEMQRDGNISSTGPQFGGWIYLYVRIRCPPHIFLYSCVQLWDAHFDCQKSKRITRYRYIETERHRDRHMISTGPHWGPPNPIFGDNFYIWYRWNT